MQPKIQKNRQCRHAAYLLTLLALVPTVIACGGDGDNGNATVTGGGAAVDTAAETEAYVYEYAKTYGGEEITILNAADIYSMRAQIDREGTTGEPLDDAMYNRCRLVEEKLEIKLVEETGEVDGGLADMARRAIEAGEDAYDFIYIPARNLYSFIEGEYLYNLLEQDALQLDQPWWSETYNNSAVIGDSLYAAIGASQLMYIDSLWCLYFNETMMTNLDMEFPYDLVREGKWTHDRLAEYLKQGVQINADNSFKWNASGTCVYGLSVGAGDKFLGAGDEFVIETDGGNLTFTAGSDRFYGLTDKIASYMRTDDGSIFLGLEVDDGQPGNYITTFETERALFLTAEICKTSRMRNADFNFGIVPMPKYDEAQSSYYAQPFYGTPEYAIPVTVADPERSAIVGDALAYTGYTDVLPIFRETTLEQKGLQNNDSIEMLDIIIKASHADLCFIFNIGSDMRYEICSAIFAGNPIASIIAKHENQIEAALAEINET